MGGPDRLPRHEGGKDSSRYSESGSGSLGRLCRGEIRPGFDASAFFGRESWRAPVIQLLGGKAQRTLSDLRYVRRLSGKTGINRLFSGVHLRSLPPGKQQEREAKDCRRGRTGVATRSASLGPETRGSCHGGASDVANHDRLSKGNSGRRKFDEETTTRIL